MSSHLLSKSVKIKIHKAKSLSVLYGCETWSLALRKEHRLSVLKNRDFRRIFPLRKDEVTGHWRKLQKRSFTGAAVAQSVTIVSDYGPDDRGSIPDRGRGFFF
jgi:hypothetical protein